MRQMPAKNCTIGDYAEGEVAGRAPSRPTWRAASERKSTRKHCGEDGTGVAVVAAVAAVGMVTVVAAWRWGGAACCV